MRFSASVLAAVLLVAAATALAASEQGRDDCGMSNPVRTGCASAVQGNGETVQALAFVHNTPDIAYSPEGDRAVANYIEMIRLDPNGINRNRNRGVRHQARTDLERTIARYSKSIMLDPKNDDAFFRRGIANFYAGSLPKARADISKASELDPKYAYYVLWLDIVDKRGNLPSRLAQSTAQIDMTKWPAPVIRLFLGQITPASALAAANDPDSDTRKSQVCEANFYIGELALRQGAKAEAARLFRLAAADCPRAFVEGLAAYA